jgi:hypothetical protein
LEYTLKHDPDGVVALFRQQSWARNVTKEQLRSAVASARAALDSPKTFSDLKARSWLHQEALKLPDGFKFPGYSPPGDVYYPIDPGRTKFEEAGDWTGWLWNCGGPTIVKPTQAPVRYHTTSAKQFIYEMPEPSANEPLPIGMVSDFGTGEYQSWYIARQLELAKFPCVFHLGDVYYAGRQKEYDGYFRGPLTNVLTTSDFYHLAENHDEYAGKFPYYAFLDANRSAARPQKQEGSYFCVRNSKFQIIGLDTISQGRRVSDPVIRAWLRERLEEGRSQKTTNILLTGAEPFEYQPGSAGNAVLSDLAPFTEDGNVHLWLWGNVHYAAFYKPTLDRLFYASCIGHGGFPFGAMTHETRGDHVMFLEPATRFPSSINIRADRGRNGWCRLLLHADGSIGMQYTDWMSNPRYQVTLVRDPNAMTMVAKDVKEFPDW